MQKTDISQCNYVKSWEKLNKTKIYETGFNIPYSDKTNIKKIL